MSTTAGLGSTEYVAVNPLAVTAIVLGLLSVVVLMGWPLLIVPIAAVIFAIVALRQIRNSNGTQTGKGLAWGGIVLGAAFVALVGTRQVLARMTAAEEQKQIAVLVSELGERMQQQDWQAIYELFSPQFQQAWQPGPFAEQLTPYLSSDYLGPLTGTTASARIHVEDYAADRRGFGNIHFSYQNLDQPVTLGAEYIKIGQLWRINSIPELFPQAEGP